MNQEAPRPDDGFIDGLAVAIVFTIVLVVAGWALWMWLR